MADHRDLDALLALLEERARVPFSWSSNHCASFAARAVKAQTGRNPMAGLRCRSRRAAAHLLDTLGGMEVAVDERLRRIPPALASRGDIAGVHDDDFGLRLLVVEGATLVGPAPRGLRRVPRAMMVAAWSAVGEIDA